MPGMPATPSSRKSGNCVALVIWPAALGLMLSTAGMEGMSGYRRYTFGRIELSQGIEIVPVAMGLFGVAEVLAGEPPA